MINPKVYNRLINTPLHKAARKIHSAVFPFPRDWMDAAGPAANNLIKEALLSNEPCLIARFGSIELESVMAYLFRNRRMMPWERFYRFASWDVRYQGWKPSLANKLCNNAGVFPVDEPLLNRFAELYLRIIPEIDILGSWIHAEMMIKDRMPHVKRIPLRDMEPYFFTTPWSEALKGKRVLVIHPFAASITAQYGKHALLFNNPKILPRFDLATLPAVQSSGGNRDFPFSSWFEALESMKDAVTREEFDIAIIGAGAYGLPLGAHVKALGKKAVHLGGATQILFGVYGKRWEDDPRVMPLINENWIRPMDADRIKNFKQIENGCYW